jgi:hypothetical protein
MLRVVGAVVVILATLVPSQAVASGSDSPRRVLFVGTPDSPRTTSFVELLEKHFARVRVADRKTFDPSSADDADVVLLDWSQGEANFPNDPSPFGDRKAWRKPTVFLGSAGLLVAMQWRIIGGSG